MRRTFEAKNKHKQHTHALTHSLTHARTHSRTHARTHASMDLVNRIYNAVEAKEHISEEDLLALHA